MLFSIIIPASRRNRPLSHALSSLLLQTYDQWEAIVIGDEMFHHTPAHAPQDRRIRFIARPTISTHGACAIGMHAARGNVITFLLPDDYISPTHLETHHDFLHSHPHLDILFGKPTIIGSPYYEDTDHHAVHHVHKNPILGTTFIREHVCSALDELPQYDLRSHLTELGYKTHTISMPSYIYDRSHKNV